MPVVNQFGDIEPTGAAGIEAMRPHRFYAGRLCSQTVLPNDPRPVGAAVDRKTPPVLCRW